MGRNLNIKKMLDVFKFLVFFLAFTVLKVTGIDFNLSRERVLLGSTGTLTMTCYVAETDVASFYLILIKRLRSTTSSGSEPDDWQTLAFMESGVSETPTLGEDITANTKDFVSGGLWDSVTPANTYLTLSMNMEKLVCNDARTYRCQFSYKNSADSLVSVKRNATFTAYVKPQVTSLIAKKNGFIVQGMSPSNMASAEVGDELELTCTAQIGSLPNTIIRWHRTSETATKDEFIGYQPPEGTFTDGTATSDNQCGYTRVATIKYNTTAADADRDNNLAFECYVTVSGNPYGNSYTTENNPKFYTEVIYPNGGGSDGAISTTDENKTCVSAGIIAAIAIASVIFGVLTGAVITWIILNRKQMAKGPGKQNQLQIATVSQETEINVSSNLPNTYEQLQNREHSDSRMTYDSLDTQSSVVPNSKPYYDTVKREIGTAYLIPLQVRRTNDKI